MSLILRVSNAPLLILSLALAGCGETADPNGKASSTTESTSNTASTTATSTEPELVPSSVTKTADTSEKTETAAAQETTPAPAPEKATASAAAGSEGNFLLEPVKFDEFLKRVANKDAKYTIVDAWASWCGPCKENFPHLVEMHKKFADKGLAVASLSFDDPSEAKQVADAREFLATQKADFPNYLLDEEFGVGYEKLNIGAIPAVFIYGPDGREVKRYTMDDPNNQFTYDEVEKDVIALLDGKPLPGKDAKTPDEK